MDMSVNDPLHDQIRSPLYVDGERRFQNITAEAESDAEFRVR